jgi:hypothetical protein
MSRSNGQNGKYKVRTKLRGKRPPKVVGRMKGRQLIDHIERMRREHTDEQEEESWAVVEESLRN